MEANIKNNYMRSEIRKDRSSSLGMGALVGIVLGLVSLSIGLVLWAFSYIEETNFHGVDAILLGTSFVLLLLGSHFLDASRKSIKKTKKVKLNL